MFTHWHFSMTFIYKTHLNNTDRLIFMSWGFVIFQLLWISNRHTTQSNIAPVISAMEIIADTLTNSTYTPIGQGLHEKFLLSSRYLKRIQNLSFTKKTLKEMELIDFRITWTRRRIGTDHSTIRTYIASDKVAQPLEYGGLAIPDSIIQTQALKFLWTRKLQNSNPELGWIKFLKPTTEAVKI